MSAEAHAVNAKRAMPQSCFPVAHANVSISLASGHAVGAYMSVAPATPLHRARWRRLVKPAFFVLASAITVWVLINNGDELLAALDNISHVSPGWLALALIAEVASYVAYAAGEQRLLAEGGARVGLIPLTELSVAAQAAAFCIPGGVAISGVVTYRVLRRFRVAPGLIVAVVFVVSALYMVALAVLALVAAAIAGTQSAIPNLLPISFALLAFVGVLIGVVVWMRRRGALARAGRRLGQAMGSFAHRVGLEGAEHPGDWAEQLAQVSFRPRAVVAATLLLLVCWLGDALCLALSFYAVGITPPWEGLLLIYAAAQLAATLPITPGGLGVLEGSLTVGLVAFGGSEASTLSAVLLYRLISFWGLLPTGGLAYLHVRRGWRRDEAARAAA
jgi:uncharacterized protein (TIRG00374 family)